MAPKSLNEMEEGQSLLRRSQSHYGEMSSTYSTISNESRASDGLQKDSPDNGMLSKCRPRLLWPFSELENVNADAVQFGVRMACCITASALFSLIRANSTQYPQAMWVLITVLFVSWFPSLDAASVVEKCLQRIYGTLLGATVGLICGFATIPLESRTLRAWIIGFCMWVYTFCICFAALQFKVKDTNSKIISRYNYACILSLLTFYISILPFSFDEEGTWEIASYRVLNVLIGCLLGAVLSISIFPRSTVGILQTKIENQIKLAGGASRAVMHNAADTFSNNTSVSFSVPPYEAVDEPYNESVKISLNPARRPWRSQKESAVSRDEALEKHDAAIQDSRIIKSQLGMLQYDPFQLGTPDEAIVTFRKEVGNTLARALRIQHTVVLLDGMIRNDPKHNFTEKQINLFADVGTLISEMLSVPLNEAAAHQLKDKMDRVRGEIIRMSAAVAEIPQKMTKSSSFHNIASMTEDDDDDDHGRGLGKFSDNSGVQVLLFLQLVEHLSLRAVRLYESWKFCQHLCYAAGVQEKRRSYTLLKLRDYSPHRR